MCMNAVGAGRQLHFPVLAHIDEGHVGAGGAALHEFAR
jgi:hypothetical protein